MAFYIRFGVSGIHAVENTSAASRLDLHSAPVVCHCRTSLPSRSMSADPRIVSLLATVTKQDTRLVSIVEETLGLLEAGNLAYRLRIPPKMVGTHPANRNGCGVSATEVHALGAEITSMGWHLGHTSHAVCVEDSEAAAIAKFSRAQALSSVGMLGIVDEGTIKYGSLSCSHTNAFLVALLCEVETTHTTIAENCRMSPSKLSTDPTLADILQNGLQWLVLSKTVPELYPSLLDLVQFAKNAAGSAQRRENEIQILMKIKSMAAASSSSVDWSSISSFVAKRNQLESSELKVYLKFVQLFGDGPFLADLHKYYQSFVPTGRVVPISTFSAIVDLKLTPAEMAPYMAVALVKAQASCPESKVQNKVCKFISVGDISALGGPKKKVLKECEGVLRQSRALVKAVGVESSVVQKKLAKLDTMVARFAVGKESKFESAAAIGHAFVLELTETLGGQKVVSPWAVAPTAVEAQASSSSIVPNMLRYDMDGRAIASAKICLASAGCVVSRGQCCSGVNLLVMFLSKLALVFGRTPTPSDIDTTCINIVQCRSMCVFGRLHRP